MVQRPDRAVQVDPAQAVPRQVYFLFIYCLMPDHTMPRGQRAREVLSFWRVAGGVGSVVFGCSVAGLRVYACAQVVADGVCGCCTMTDLCALCTAAVKAKRKCFFVYSFLFASDQDGQAASSSDSTPGVADSTAGRRTAITVHPIHPFFSCPGHVLEPPFSPSRPFCLPLVLLLR